MARNNAISFEIKGLEELFSQLDTMSARVEESTTETLKKTTTKVRELAIILAPTNDGQLRNSIKARVEGFVGEVYVNVIDVPYVGYVYYGTGVYAKLGGTGKKSWKVPISKVTKDVTKYGWQVHQGYNGYEDYYIVKGQVAKPFLDWAMASTKQANLDIIKEELEIAIKGCL